MLSACTRLTKPCSHLWLIRPRRALFERWGRDGTNGEALDGRAGVSQPARLESFGVLKQAGLVRTVMRAARRITLRTGAPRPADFEWT